MDTLTYHALITSSLFGAIAGLTVCLGIVWLFSKKMRLKHLAELRKKLDELAPVDPEYGQVRALYTSMVIDAQRWGFFAFESGSDADNGNVHHAGSDHAADAGGGGDGH